MLKKIVLSGVITTFSFASSATLMSDDIFSLSLEDLQNIIVVSASKSEQKVGEAPAKMFVVTKEQIEKRGFKSLDELLNALPGITIHNYTINATYNTALIRGIKGSNYFKILQDGIEIDQTTGEPLGIGMNFPLFGIKRVEVLYGPASVIYGADAISGVINIITDDSEASEAMVSYGEDGYEYHNFRFAKKVDNLFYSIKGHFNEDQNYHFAKTHPEIYNSAIDGVAEANRNYDVAPNASKSFNAYFKGEKFKGGINYSHLRVSTSMASKSYKYLYENKANFYTNLKGAYLTYETNFLNDFHSSTTISYDASEVSPKSYYKNEYTNYENAYKYSIGERYAIEEIVTKSFDNHHITAGVNFERFHSIPLSYDLPKPYDKSKDGSEQNYFYTGTNLPVNYFETYWSNSAIFIQDQIDINEAFKLYLAGRYDINSEYENSFNPRVALIYRQNETTTHKLIYSEAFLAPSTYNKYKHFGAITENDIVGDTNPYKAVSKMRVPNRDLEPEKSKSLEYSIQSYFDKTFMVDFSLFYNQISNLVIEQDVFNDTTSFPLVTIEEGVRSVNVGEGEMYGFEFHLDKKLKFSDFDLNLWGNYSYLDGSLDLYNRGDTELPAISLHQINAGFNLSYGKFLISPNFEWADKYRTQHPEDDGKNMTELDGEFIVNFYGAYKFNKNMEVTLKVENLTNRDYAKPRDSDSSFMTAYQPERLAIVAMKFKF